MILLSWYGEGKVLHVLEFAPYHEGMWRIKGVFHICLSLTLGGGYRVDSCDACFTSERGDPDIHITGA